MRGGESGESGVGEEEREEEREEEEVGRRERVTEGGHKIACCDCGR